MQGGPKIADVTAIEEGPQGTGTTGKLTTFVRGGRGALDTSFGDKGRLIQLYGPGSEASAYEAKTFRDGSIVSHPSMT